MQGEASVLRPGHRRHAVWAMALALVALALAVPQMVGSQGTYALLATLAALAAAPFAVVSLVNRAREDTRVDLAGITLPDQPSIPWSLVERITDRPHDRVEKRWHLVLRDGTSRVTPFRAPDDTLYRWWRDHVG